MATLGYEKAKNLMKQLDWKMLVKTCLTTHGEDVEEATLYHPRQLHVHVVRRDAARRLLRECRECGQAENGAAIFCYNHSGSNEKLI